MNIFDYAIQMERDGEAFYRNLALSTANKGLKEILTFLANAEVIHAEKFGMMKKGLKVQVTDSEILNNVKTIFVRMKEESDIRDADASQINLYKKAQELEVKTREFYREKAGEVTDSHQADALLRIADEENKHYFILENIISFISRPQQWLEGAEWYHLDEY